MGVIQTGPGSPLAFSSASGGKVTGFNNITNAGLVQVLPANPQRQSLTFHNPGTVDIYVAPAINAAGAALAPTLAAKGGLFLVFANGGSLTITGECQFAWNAIAAAGNGNPFTAMESNI